MVLSRLLLVIPTCSKPCTIDDSPSYRSVEILALDRDEQEHRALALFRPFGPRRDLRVRWSPFLHMRDREAEPDEEVESGSEGAVLLDHPVSQPVGPAGAFLLIGVHRPGPASVRTERPAGFLRRRHDRVLDRKHES